MRHTSEVSGADGMAHVSNMVTYSGVAREDLEIRRKIREAVEIRIWRPEMNRDTGFDLPPVLLPLLSCDCRRHGGHMTN